MYQYTKVSNKTQLFISQISSENKSRTLPVTIALSRLLAYKLPLPSAPVDCIDSFFNTQIAVDVTMNVNVLNELMFIDADAVMEYIRKFYTYRYNQVNPSLHLLLKPETAVYDMFKITKSFSADVLTEISASANYINELTNRFIDLLSELEGV